MQILDPVDEKDVVTRALHKEHLARTEKCLVEAAQRIFKLNLDIQFFVGSVGIPKP